LSQCQSKYINPSFSEQGLSKNRGGLAGFLCADKKAVRRKQMSKRIDIPLGCRFGNLTVVEESGRSPRGDIMWLCKCDCGSEKRIMGYALRNGNNVTCGSCPPNNVYRVDGDVVYGSVGGGLEFMIDTDDLQKVSQYQWHRSPPYNYIISCSTLHNLKLHRLITGFSHKYVVDHINGNPLDNRKCNLRVCTHQENMWNRKTPKTNTTGYKGVCKPKRYGRYVAGIRVDGRQKHLGCFDTALEAAMAYDSAARFYRGEFARINFPTDDL
jgi:hypothetical protein